LHLYLILSQRTNQGVIFKEEQEGGLGLLSNNYYTDANFIIHHTYQLNNDCGYVRNAARKLFLKSPTESTDDLYNSKYTWNKYKGLLVRYGIEIKSSKGAIILTVNDRTVELRKNKEGVSQEVRDLKKFIKKASAELYKKEISNDWIGRYKDEAHPKSLLIQTKTIKRYETNTLISTRMGCQIEENFAHPSICKCCKSTENLIHTYLTCNQALKKAWGHHFKEIQNVISGRIHIVWEDQLDRNLLQITPRGLISYKLGEILENKKKDLYIIWIQDIAGSFLTKKLEMAYKTISKEIGWSYQNKTT